MLEKVKKFVNLPSADQWLFVKTAVILSMVTAGLFVLPFQQFMQHITRFWKARRRSSFRQQTNPDKIVWAVRSVSRFVPYARCLSQALTVKTLLLNYEYPVFLKIGVAKSTENRIQAHAWIESRGKILIGELRDFSQYYVLPELEEQNS